MQKLFKIKNTSKKYVYKCDYCGEYFDDGIEIYNDWHELNYDDLVMKNVYICNKCIELNSRIKPLDK